MAEYTIVGLKEVRDVLLTLLPYLRLKRRLAEQIVALVKAYPTRMTPKKLIRLSKLVDRTAKFNYSRKRTNTSETVQLYLKKANLIPVETEGKCLR
jgi:hypothetical protein